MFHHMYYIYFMYIHMYTEAHRQKDISSFLLFTSIISQFVHANATTITKKKKISRPFYFTFIYTLVRIIVFSRKEIRSLFSFTRKILKIKIIYIYIMYIVYIVQARECRLVLSHTKLLLFALSLYIHTLSMQFYIIKQIGIKNIHCR